MITLSWLLSGMVMVAILMNEIMREDEPVIGKILAALALILVLIGTTTKLQG